MKTTQKQQIRLLEDVIRKQIRSAIKESVIKEVSGGPGYSSREAKNIIENSIDDYAKILRKAQYKVIKDWMSKAKGGVLDYFDIMRGIKTNSVQRTHPYEAEFLVNVLRTGDCRFWKIEYDKVVNNEDALKYIGASQAMMKVNFEELFG